MKKIKKQNFFHEKFKSSTKNISNFEFHIMIAVHLMLNVYEEEMEIKNYDD